jgi:putative hemolysin
MTGLLLAVAGVLLLCSALLSAAETAAFSISASRMRTLREEGFRGAETLHRIREEAPGARPILFLASTVLNISAVALALTEAIVRFGPRAVIWVLPAGIAAVLVVGEGVPRLAASRRGLRLGLLSAPLIALLHRVFWPLLRPFVQIDDLLAGRNEEDRIDTEERELIELADLGRREGVVEEEERRLVERAFRMDELSAWDIMTPRVDIFAWKDSMTLDEVTPELRDVPHSRVPVYGESIDDVTGILYVREAYEAIVAGRGELRLSQLAREPFFVPGSVSLPRLLRDFQARRIHMGIVADEFGGTDGLVTLEDVLEELVGEIEDERDVQEEPLLRISRSEVHAEGGVELREVNQALGVMLPHLEHRSLNGFILEEMGRVPAAGEKLQLPDLEIEVIESTDTQVLRARLRRTQTVTAEGAG